MDQPTVNEQEQPTVDFIFPETFWIYIDGKEKDKILQSITMLFFKDHIAINERGQLLYSKTGLNSLKKILINVMTLADKAAANGESNLSSLSSAAAEQKASKKKQLSAEERMKKIGLVNVMAKLPEGKLIV